MVENTYIIIQARMNSSRFPGKVMKNIDGIPLIGILIERLKKLNVPIILATSINSENDKLIRYVESLHVQTYRGSEQNVLERYYLAAKKYNAKTIVRLTGDNPLIDGQVLHEMLERYWKEGNLRSYLSTSITKSFPLGMSIEIFGFDLLKEAYSNATLAGELEHVTPYFYNNNSAKNIKIIGAKLKESKYHYRLTVDTISDFSLIKKLITDFNCKNKSMQEIINIIDDNHGLLKINRNIHQKGWDE